MAKYMVKLKGTDCYLINTSGKSHFTTDIKKAKVFEEDYKKRDFIDKLAWREYKVKRDGANTDHIRLTMDRPTWQEMFNEHRDQIQKLSDSRMLIHQYAMSLADKFEIKAKTYGMSQDYPNFETDYYAEDFEREYLY